MVEENALEVIPILFLVILKDVQLIVFGEIGEISVLVLRLVELVHNKEQEQIHLQPMEEMLVLEIQARPKIVMLKDAL